MKKKGKKVIKKTKAPVEAPVEIPAETPPNYSARIKILGHIYETAGQTAAEAITNLKPLKGRGVSVLTVSKDGKERSKILNPIITMRLFSPSRIVREMGLKAVLSIFSDL